MTLARTSDLWWKDAIVCYPDVEAFRDADGDRTGDFRLGCDGRLSVELDPYGSRWLRVRRAGERLKG